MKQGKVVKGPTFGLQDPPQLQGKGHPVEERRGEPQQDGGGEEGTAAAGVQQNHPPASMCSPDTPSSRSVTPWLLESTYGHDGAPPPLTPWDNIKQMDLPSQTGTQLSHTCITTVSLFLICVTKEFFLSPQIISFSPFSFSLFRYVALSDLGT